MWPLMSRRWRAYWERPCKGKTYYVCTDVFLTSIRIRILAMCVYSSFSADYVDFLMRCLHVNPDQRDTAESLLTHPYLHRCLPELYTHSILTGEHHPRVPRLRRASGSEHLVCFKCQRYTESLIQKISYWYDIYYICLNIGQNYHSFIWCIHVLYYAVFYIIYKLYIFIRYIYTRNNVTMYIYTIHVYSLFSLHGKRVYSTDVKDIWSEANLRHFAISMCLPYEAFVSRATCIVWIGSVVRVISVCIMVVYSCIRGLCRHMHILHNTYLYWTLTYTRPPV